MAGAAAALLAGAAGPAEGADQRWSVLPVAGYSTETTLFVGGMAVHYLPAAPATRGSAIPVVAYGSLKGQYRLLAVPDLHARGNAWHVALAARARRWPASFYARGNASGEASVEYEARGYELSVAAQRRLGSHLFAGPQLRLADEGVRWRPPSRQPAVPGARGGTLAGLGLTASWDTRDNPRDARAGTLLLAAVALYRPAWGSDFDCTELVVQVRRFRGLGRSQALGLAGDLRLSGGRPPFGEWSTADGVSQLRGIEAGRYRDSHLLSLQAEYRRSWRGPLGGAIFADAAQVARSAGDFDLRRLRWALGAGGRFALNRTQRYNLRLDAAWVDGGPGFVFTAGEAF